ncbi:MAG: TRAM domain-containing protein [Armatimonadetes bacterium]|nr:TRAM domain-containing protein [Armatimonadota bacterium]
MSKRTTWTFFMLVFMVSGAYLAALLAESYVRKLGVDGGRILWLDVSTLKPLTPTGRLLAKVAFSLGGLLVGYIVWSQVDAELQRLRRSIDVMSTQDKLAGVIGVIVGLLVTMLITVSLSPPWPLSLVIAIFLCYLSVTVALSMKEQLSLGGTSPGKYPSSNLLRPKILDTNVIIDGRIADICKAGFVEGPIYIPRFVLEELQQIADSSDSLKRARGRRGLDILNQMQKEMSLQIQTYEAENGGFPDEVDAKLVQLAKEISGSIVTNDYNLNKVAAIQGVKVLNVNELANALKPVVLPGENMRVTIIKEGKEQNQGVGYLDDGTMIVVERARRLTGDTVDVVVTSILQTAAGKMIFANLKAEYEEDNNSIERNVRSYSSGRQRKKIR